MFERGAYYLGNVGPMPVFVHPSALLMVLMAFVWTDGNIAFASALLLALVLGIVLHEFGHGVAALVQGARNVRVTLWALGGVCESQRDYIAKPWREVIILVAGPAVSFLLAWAGLLLGDVLAVSAPGVLVKDPERWPGARAILEHWADFRFAGALSMTGLVLSMIFNVNLWLGIFNCLPIYPLDGGQIVYNVQRGFGVRDAIARNVSLVLAYATAAAYLTWRSYELGWQMPGIYTIVFVGFLLYITTMRMRMP